MAKIAALLLVVGSGCHMVEPKGGGQMVSGLRLSSLQHLQF